MRAAKGLLVAGTLAAAAPGLAAPKALAPGEGVDLNRATVSELMRVPGIGERKAQAIVALRRRQPFRRVEDVLAVRGLGPAWLARTRGYLLASPPAPAGPVATR